MAFASGKADREFHALGRAGRVLDQGRDLSSALMRHQELFGAFYISMIRVGEMTGRLTRMLLRLNEHMEFERDVRERIKQAMRYPIFVMIAMGIAIVILNIFVIPVFAKVFAGFNAQLPLITRGLLASSVGCWHGGPCCWRWGLPQAS